MTKKWQALLKKSEFLASINKLKNTTCKSRLFGDAVRALTANEIKKLEQQGSQSDNWEKILVASNFSTEHIHRCRLFGKCVLGVFSGEEVNVDSSLSLPPGLYNTTFVNSEMGSECAVHQSGIISNYIIGEHAAIIQSHELSGTENSNLGIGQEIRVGNETGGREVYAFAEMTIEDAFQIATRRGDRAFLQSYQDFMEAYKKSCCLDFGVVESESVIRNCGKIINAFVGKNTVLDNATLVDNCTILSSKEEPVQISHGAILQNSVVQWGAQITTHAIVENSVLTESSRVERHGIVSHSIIGPNTKIAEGEVTSSLVGPFVGFHHQALLIAALWPDGKGNVGYGANVGSNHTSKAPDQEIHIGEGVFFGLGTNIKFPSNFKDAPYSIIATGVDTLPQKVQFPFSLINKQRAADPDINPQLNEIFPAWVLAENLYMVYRCEAKFRDRNKAARTEIPFNVFRPEIIDKMIAARCRLDNIKQKQSLFTEKEIPGLGKNVITNHSRKSGVETYTFFIQYYALKGVMRQLESLENKNEDLTEILYKKKTDDKLWEHQRRILEEEGLVNNSLEDNLHRLSDMQERVAQKVQRSKEKDDSRGEKFIDDYREVNILAQDDKLVQQVWKETEDMKMKIEKLIKVIQ